MDAQTVTVELPLDVYARLQRLALAQRVDPAAVIARLVSSASDPVEAEHDPILDLIGAYRSDQPLIDGIPVSEDPDLYLAAAQLGPRAYSMHAWDVAPHRYGEGPQGQPIRRALDEVN